MRIEINCVGVMLMYLLQVFVGSLQIIFSLKKASTLWNLHSFIFLDMQDKIFL